MALLSVSGLETHPAGANNPNSIINGNWNTLEAAFAGGQSVFVPAALLTVCATDAAAGLASRTVASGGPRILAMTFAQSADSGAETVVFLPRTYDVGSVAVDLLWTANGTGTVVWGVAAAGFADAASLNAAYSGEVTGNGAVGTANNLKVTTISLTPANAGKNSLTALRIRRVGTNGSDTLAATAELLGVRLRFTRNQTNES